MSKTELVSRVSLAFGIIALLLLPSGVGLIVAQDNPRIELAVDTANFNQDGLLAIFGGLRFGGEKGLPVGAGDINGDGRADVIFCQMYGSAGGANRLNNGRVNFYISDGRDTGVVDVAQNPPNIFTLFGANSGDLLGTSVATGDVNGDGIRDVALGAAGDDGPGNTRFNSGAVYLVLGSQNFSIREDLGLSSTLPPGVIAIYGGQASSRTGIWVDIGDLDGDGFGDIVMGSDQVTLDSNSGFHVGAACVIFGSPSLPQVIDLANLPAGVRMTAIVGADREDHWGSALHVGDLNNDGFADVAVAGAIFRDSASYVTPQDQTSGHDARAADNGGTRPFCGEVKVIYGSRNMPARIDLKNPPANSTHVIGANINDLLGSQIHSADLNGDGRRELIIGALQALAPDNRGRTGAVYVIYGEPALNGARIDLATPDSSGLRVTTIYGENHLDCGGDSVRSFDINNDRLSDLFIGSPEHTFIMNGEVRQDAGDTKFFFGQRDFLPPVIKLYDPPPGLRIFRLAGAHGDGQGQEGGDEMSYRLAGGDVDGDGFVDYIANAMHGDGLNNATTNTGNLYVFSGKKLSARLGFLGPVIDPDPDPAPTLATATLSTGGQNNVQQALAGQSNLRITINGTGFRPDTEITVNGAVVIARIPADPQLAATQRVIALDDNPAIKNSVGTLLVRARNTSPASNPTIEVNAGRLVGPEIIEVRDKRKSSGQIQLKIDGANFDEDATVTVLDPNGQQVRLKSVNVDGNDFIKVKISASAAPPRGTPLRVRVVNFNLVVSNEVIVAP